MYILQLSGNINQHSADRRTILNWQIPDIEIVTLGSTRIAWLDKELRVERCELDAILVAEEAAKALSIKATSRKDEFERSRYLLRKMTGCTQAFLPDDQNVPVWPAPYTGSITHKNGHVAVTCEENSSHLSIGIDCEDAKKDISHLKEKICSPAELVLLEQLAAKESLTLGALVALVFAAKEALFKCHHPIGRKIFWFHDAEVVDLDFSAGRIEIKVLIKTSDRTPAGHQTIIHFTEKSASDGIYWLVACSET